MKETGNTNWHHNIPKSHGGSTNVSNYIRIAETDHAQFHHIFKHLTPDQLVRMIALITAKDGLPPSMVSDVLRVMSADDIYDKKSTVELHRDERLLSANNTELRAPYLKANACLSRCRSHIDTIRTDLKNVFISAVPTRTERQMERYLDINISDLNETLDKYSQLLPQISRANNEQRVTVPSVATHTAFQCIREAKITLDTIRSMLGANQEPSVARLRKSSLHFFGAENGVEMLKTVLTKQNKDHAYYFTNPLLPSVRGEAVSCVKGKPEQLNARTRKHSIRHLVFHFEKLLNGIAAKDQPIILPFDEMAG